MRRKGPPPPPSREPAPCPAAAQPAGRPGEVSLAPWLVGAGLVAAVLIGYAPVLGKDSQYFNLDDTDYILGNPHVNTGLSSENIVWAFTKFHAGNWHPLTWLSLQLDVELYGETDRAGRWDLPAWGFHLTNALLHAAAGVLLMLTLTRMTGAFWRSALVAALFALHPLRVESVAWAAERKDVLGSLLWVITMLAYDWYVRRPGWGRYLWVMVAFALGLMAKPLLVTLPCALLLLDYWPLRRVDSPRAWKRLTLEKLPLFALSAAACIVTVLAQGVAETDTLHAYPAQPFGLRILNAGRAYVAYVTKTFWPADLAPLYTEPRELFPVGWAAAACLIVVAVTIVVLVFARTRPYLIVGWFWYLGTLVPMIGIVAVGIQTMADRYTYVPHIGLFLLLVWVAGDVLPGPLPARALATMAGALVLACLVATYLQARLWRTNVDIWARAVRVTDNNFGAQDMYGLSLIGAGKPGQAVGPLREAVRTEPRYAVSHFHLGEALEETGDWAGAAASYEASLGLEPRFLPAKAKLGLCCMQLGRMEEAIEPFEAVAQAEPGRVEFHYNLGMALLYRDRLDEAEREAREALRLEPRFVLARKLLGYVLAVRGKPAEARQQFEAVPPPDETAGYYIAWALRAEGRTEASRQLYRIAAQNAPKWPRSQRDEAWRLATDRDPKRRSGRLALLRAEVASQAAEDRDASALDALAASQAELGRFDEAVATLRKAIALGGAPDAKGMNERLRLYEMRQPYRE